MKRINFVRFPFIKFEKAKLYSWAKEFYIDSENRAEREVKEAYRECAKYIEQGNHQKAEELRLIYDFQPQYDIVFELMKNFTLKEPNDEVHETYATILEQAGYNVEIDDKTLKIHDDGKVIEIERFSDLEPNILKILPDIDKPERGGKCHPYSVLTAVMYKNKTEFDTHLVTGRIYQLSHKFKYLHSWVEISRDGKTYIIDPSKNLVIDRDSYYEINHVQGTERISANQVSEDYKMIRRLTDYDGYIAKVYYENRANGLKLYRRLVSLGEISEAEPENK